MSRTIDERIVQMIFDNKEFDKNISQSMSSLDKFDKQLDGFEKESALAGLSSSVEKIGGSFSAMSEIAIGALRRIGEHITDFVIGKIDLLTSKIGELTFDQVGAGFDKFTDKAESMQTILGATRNYYQDILGDSYTLDAQMDLVNEQMQKLNWFTDETSYSYTDMVNNIGKFTSNNIALEEATDAMMGIAAWGATAGANVQEVGRAMYNISQAMSVGAMTTIDWKSIQNANMATSEFKEMAVQAAIAQGTLKDAGDGLYETLTGNQYNINELFTERLTKDRWFDQNVMSDVFSMYGDFSAQLYDFGQLVDGAMGLELTSQQLDLITRFKEGSVGIDELRKIADQAGISVEELDEALTLLTDDQYELGLRAFKAAQEYKTFKDVVDATMDAASTHWMNIFELIFGNFLEQKEIWTTVGEEMYTIFVGPLDKIIDALDYWRNQAHGNEWMLEGFSNLYSVLKDIIGIIDDVFGISDALGKLFNGPALFRYTQQFTNWTQELKSSIENSNKFRSAIESLHGIFKGFVATGRFVLDFFLEFLNFISPVTDAVKDLIGFIFTNLGNFGNWLSEALPDRSAISDWFSNITKHFTKFKEVLGNFRGSEKPLISFSEAFENFSERVEKRMGPVKSFFSAIGKLLSVLFQGLTLLAPVIGKLLSAVGNGISSFADMLSEAFGSGDFSKVFDLINGGALSAIAIGIARFVNGIGDIGKGTSGVLGSLKKTISGVGDVFEGWQKKLNAEALKEIAVAIAIIAASLFALALIDSEKLTGALAGLTVAFGELAGFMMLMNKQNDSSNFGAAIMNYLDAKSMDKTATALIKVAAAVLVLSVAMNALARLSWEGIAKGLVSIGTLLLMLTVSMNKLSRQGPKGATAMIIMAAAISILASAVNKLASLSWEELAKGLVGTVSLVTAMTIAFNSMPKDAPKGATSMVLLATSLVIVAQAVKTMGTLSLPDLAKGLGGVVVALVAMVAAVNLMRGSLGNAGAMVLVATSLLEVAAVVKIFASMSLPELAKGLIALAVALAEMVIAMNLMNGSIVGAAAMLIMANALVVLAGAVFLFGSMSLGTIAKGLITLAAAFTIIGVAGALLGPVAPTIILLGVGITALGVGCLAAGAGLVLFAAGLSALAATGSLAINLLIELIKSFILLLPEIGIALANALTSFIVSLSTNGSEIIAALGNLFSTILTEIRNRLPEILATVTAVIIGVLNTIQAVVPELTQTIIVLGHAALAAMRELLPDFVNTIITILDATLQSIANHVPNFIQSGITIIMSFIQGIRQFINLIVEEFMGIITDTLTAVANRLPELIQAGWDLIIAIVDGIAQGIEDNTERLRAAMERLAKAMIDFVKSFLGIRSPSQVFHDEVGVNISEGIKEGILSVKDHIADGLRSALGSAKEAAMSVASTFSDIGHNVVEGIKNGIQWASDGLSYLGASLIRLVKGGAEAEAQIHSPSRVFAWIGEMLDQGLVNGITSNLDSVDAAGHDMANQASLALREAMNHIGDGVDDDITMTPVIRPVVDLSDIESGSSKINNMLSGSGFYTAGIGDLGISTTSNQASLLNAINGLNANQNPYNGINIYVTGNDNASAEDIADEVMRRLDREVQRRKAAFG